MKAVKHKAELKRWNFDSDGWTISHKISGSLTSNFTKNSLFFMIYVRIWTILYGPYSMVVIKKVGNLIYFSLTLSGRDKIVTLRTIMLICCFTRTAFPFTSWYCQNSLSTSHLEFFTASQLSYLDSHDDSDVFVLIVLSMEFEEYRR